MATRDSRPTDKNAAKNAAKAGKTPGRPGRPRKARPAGDDAFPDGVLPNGASPDDDADDGAAGAPASRSAVPLLYDNDDLSARHASDRKFVWALARGLEILRAFKPGQGALGNNELTAVTKLPKATVTRLTYTLTELGYLNFIKRLSKYEPTPAILALGYPVLANLRVRQIAHDYMQQLANHANASVALASPDRISMIYVDAVNAGNLNTLMLDIGSRVDIATTAIGRAYLAAVSEDARQAAYEGLAKRHGPNWPDLKARVEGSIAEVRDRGFCFLENEWRRDVRAVGAPLVSPDGGAVMAMNCGSPTFAIDRDRLINDYGPRLVHLCRTIAPMMGR